MAELQADEAFIEVTVGDGVPAFGARPTARAGRRARSFPLADIWWDCLAAEKYFRASADVSSEVGGEAVVLRGVWTPPPSWTDKARFIETYGSGAHTHPCIEQRKRAAAQRRA